jgi:hypothetical protein
MATMTMPAVRTATSASAKLITRFRQWADALQPKIEHAGRPMTQNPTPKRQREYQSRMHDCRNLERTQRALRALADAHEAGTVPPELAALAKKAEIELSNFPGYFPTQAPVIEIMLRRARILPGMTVLEPEAGSGHIADGVSAAVPGVILEVIEPVSKLQEMLELKGYKLVGSDLLQLSRSELGQYDRIVMNPPFERQQDLDHIRHAYKLLAPHGILVSVLSPSFEFRSDRKSTEFRNWLQEVNATWENLPDGSFKASGTGVSTRLLVVER